MKYSLGKILKEVSDEIMIKKVLDVLVNYNILCQRKGTLYY